MPEPEILTDSQQMLARALAAKDAEIEHLTAAVAALHVEIEQRQALFRSHKARAEEVQIASNAYIDGLRAALKRHHGGHDFAAGGIACAECGEPIEATNSNGA